MCRHRDLEASLAGHEATPAGRVKEALMAQWGTFHTFPQSVRLCPIKRRLKTLGGQDGDHGGDETGMSSRTRQSNRDNVSKPA